MTRVRQLLKNSYPAPQLQGARAAAGACSASEPFRQCPFLLHNHEREPTQVVRKLRSCQVYVRSTREAAGARHGGRRGQLEWGGQGL